MKARLVIAPQLVHWVVRSNDLQADVAAAPDQPGTIVNMTRGTLTWRLTVPRGGRPAGDGMLPSMIQWDLPADQHPTARLPDVGVALAGLSIRAPQAVLTRLPKISTPVTIETVESATSTLVATFNCPKGRVSLGG